MSNVERHNNIEHKGDVVSFEDRVEQAHARAERGLGSDKLSEILPAATQALAFEDMEDSEPTAATVSLWNEKLEARLAS